MDDHKPFKLTVHIISLIGVALGCLVFVAGALPFIKTTFLFTTSTMNGYELASRSGADIKLCLLFGFLVTAITILVTFMHRLSTSLAFISTCLFILAGFAIMNRVALGGKSSWSSPII